MNVLAFSLVLSFSHLYECMGGAEGTSLLLDKVSLDVFPPHLLSVPWQQCSKWCLIHMWCQASPVEWCAIALCGEPVPFDQSGVVCHMTKPVTGQGTTPQG